jgi:hypothetical protein
LGFATIVGLDVDKASMERGRLPSPVLPATPMLHASIIAVMLWSWWHQLPDDTATATAPSSWEDYLLSVALLTSAILAGKVGFQNPFFNDP